MVWSEASSSPESRFPPRQLDGATHTCWCESPGTAATPLPSDDGRPDPEQLSQHDPSTSTQEQPESSQQDLESHLQEDNAQGEPGRCISCGQKRKVEMFYTIEDLDAIEPAPVDARFTEQLCGCEELGATGGNRPDLRKIRSTETRWANTSFLSPDDALWDLRRNASDGTEYRWELHASKTDLELSKRGKCSCHSLLTPEKKPERGDLRKHHSAEYDKWSIQGLLTPQHDLRKHASDDTKVGREARWTLQVPDVLPNPKPRCTCPKSKIVTPSPTLEREDRPVMRELVPSRSFEKPTLQVERPELKKHASEDTRHAQDEQIQDRARQIRPVPSTSAEGPTSRPTDLFKSFATLSQDKKSSKEKVTCPESKKSLRSRWASKPHFSLPVQKDSKWSKSHDDPKSKSMKDRHKYSVRRSISPEPDPRLLMRFDNRVVKRLISPEIMITDAKWAPYEGYSPLPSIGIKKRETKKISEIKWTPYDRSPSDTGDMIPEEIPEEEETQEWSPFDNVTPPHILPPEAAPCLDEEEAFLRRMLNQVSPFPIYQGAWKDESPPRSPPKVETLELSTPVWSPLKPATPVNRRRPTPSPPEKTSTLKSIRKRGFRARSESKHGDESRLAPPKSVIRASSEDPKSRQRPQLVRSQALLEVPKNISATKRSLSEEVPSRSRHSAKAPNRAKSEEVPNYGDPWFPSENELRQYVTTV